MNMSTARDPQTIVSQDVGLFSGTVASNLDLFSEHTDAKCWDVLERCPLILGSRTYTGAIKDLHMNVSWGESSFSAGQMQLLALACAMLRRSAFVILDEASLSIDMGTDSSVNILGLLGYRACPTFCSKNPARRAR